VTRALIGLAARGQVVPMPGRSTPTRGPYAPQGGTP